MEPLTKTRKDPRDVADGERGRQTGALLFRLACADALEGPSARIPLARFAEVELVRAQAASLKAEGAALRLGLADAFASTRHARLTSPGGAWQLADEGSTNGTRVNGERLAAGARVPLREGDLIEIGHTFFLFRAGAIGSAPLFAPEESGGRATICPEWERELERVDRLSRTAHAVLLQGESGAGKEVLARQIHAASGRSGALVSVNCAALPEHLLEDELFGHTKGAFSGAQGERLGLFRAADQGTLFLDEVGDMPAGLQAKLLRVLEDGRVRPLGSEREVAVDVRIVAATHRDLPALAEAQRFRHDLLARLGLLPVRIPPLRARREDLGILIRAILAEAGGPAARCTQEAMRLLFSYRWPLNVRELRQAVLTARDLASPDGSGGVVIAPEHLPAAVQAPSSVAAPAAPEPDPAARAEALRRLSPADRELRAKLVEVLRRTGGNNAAAARELGKARVQVQRWIARLGIDIERIRRGEE